MFRITAEVRRRRNSRRTSRAAHCGCDPSARCGPPHPNLRRFASDTTHSVARSTVIRRPGPRTTGGPAEAGPRVGEGGPMTRVRGFRPRTASSVCWPSPRDPWAMPVTIATAASVAQASASKRTGACPWPPEVSRASGRRIARHCGRLPWWLQGLPALSIT